MTECKKTYSIDDARYTLDRTTEMINSCDNKSSITLGFVGVVAGILLTDNFIPKGLTIIGNNFELLKFKFYFAFLCIITTIFVLGIAFLFSVFFAKFNKSGLNSKIFFTDIASNESLQAYKEQVLMQNEEDMLNDLVNQIYINAKICTDKYKRYRRGIKFIVSSVCAFLLGTFIFTII